MVTFSQTYDYVRYNSPGLCLSFNIFASQEIRLKLFNLAFNIVKIFVESDVQTILAF